MLILCFWLLSPLNLEAGHFKFKLGLGFSSYGKIEDTWVMTSNFYDFHLSSGEKTGMPLDASIDLVYQFNPNFGLSIGTGYISGGISGSLGRFSFPQGNNLGGDFAYNPLLNSQLFPIVLSAIWSYPVMLEGEIHVLGGLGFYFGKISCVQINFESNLHDPEHRWSYFNWTYKSRFNSLGFHGGIGFDYAVSNQFDIYIEALYRIVNIRDFNSLNRASGASSIFYYLGDEIIRLGDKSTFLYAQRFGGEEGWGDIDYRISNLNFSGISLRLGFMFKF
jgi:hypothetical protein